MRCVLDASMALSFVIADEFTAILSRQIDETRAADHGLRQVA